MKKSVLALALFFSFAGVSLADNTPNATNNARQLANALKLNEAQYLQIRNLEKARLAELGKTNSDAKAINDKFTVALLEVLSKDQQEAYKSLVKMNSSTQQEALLKN
ncbi:hypothetical protein [Sabulibacter ruber]|uniref:hypothetical protein n=1 Tax=Sabulibacter ruber TaxID=2811901 RepID=UPI001A95685F|nr:hypothetical protein [Sabulibacter ruber]